MSDHEKLAQLYYSSCGECLVCAQCGHAYLQDGDERACDGCSAGFCGHCMDEHKHKTLSRWSEKQPRCCFCSTKREERTHTVSYPQLHAWLLERVGMTEQEAKQAACKELCDKQCVLERSPKRRIHESGAMDVKQQKDCETCATCDKPIDREHKWCIACRASFCVDCTYEIRDEQQGGPLFYNEGEDEKNHDNARCVACTKNERERRAKKPSA